MNEIKTYNQIMNGIGEQEVSSQKDVSSPQDKNDNSIYQCKLKNIHKYQEINNIRKEIEVLKNKTWSNLDEIKKIYDLIFKNFTDERIVIKKITNDEHDRTILATSLKGFSYLNFWSSNLFNEIEVGDNYSKIKDTYVTRLHPFENSYFRKLLIWISEDYDNVSKIMKKTFTDLKYKRFERFFSLIDYNIVKDLNNLFENNYVLDKKSIIKWINESDGEEEEIVFDNISFDSSDTNVNKYIQFSEFSEKLKTQEKGYNYYPKSFTIDDYEKLEQCGLEVRECILKYLEQVKNTEKIMSDFKDKIKNEFSRELVFQALSKDGN